MDAVLIRDLVQRQEVEIKTGPFGTQLKASEYVNEGTPVLNVRNLGFSTVNTEKLEMVGDETLERLSAHKLHTGDIVFGRKGAVERHAYIGENEDGWMQGSDCIRLRVKSDSINARYLSYYFLTPQHRAFMISMCSHGTTMASLNQKIIEMISVPLPERKAQDQVVAVLSALDEKARINREINDNLEQQAVLLFRSWFSNFSQSQNVKRQDSEFGEIPSDFSVVKVGSLSMLVTDYVANGSFASLKENVTLYQEPNYAYFVRNTDLKSGSFGVYVDQHSYEFLSKSTLYGGEIIISNVGDVGSVFLCPKLDGPMTLGNNIIMLRPENDVLRYYLYIWFKDLQGQALIQGIKGGSAQPKFNKTDFKNTSVILPPLDLLSRFHETIAPMFEAITQNQAENKRLSDLRDALLPQLMSGEIDISSIDL